MRTLAGDLSSTEEDEEGALATALHEQLVILQEVTTRRRGTDYYAPVLGAEQTARSDGISFARQRELMW